MGPNARPPRPGLPRPVQASLPQPQRPRSAHLDSGLRQVDLERHLLAHEDVWVAGLGEQRLEDVQLRAREGGALPPLLPRGGCGDTGSGPPGGRGAAPDPPGPRRERKGPGRPQVGQGGGAPPRAPAPDGRPAAHGAAPARPPKPTTSELGGGEWNGGGQRRDARALSRRANSGESRGSAGSLQRPERRTPLPPAALAVLAGAYRGSGLLAERGPGVRAYLRRRKEGRAGPSADRHARRWHHNPSQAVGAAGGRKSRWVAVS